ncbi:Lon protease family protein [Thalassospira alkalitolerans]|uniref:Lon protease family protein n=1 Tax=Thalassospira alkalitolerans TaxID=1293890 RepID=UPI003AA9E0C7
MPVSRLDADDCGFPHFRIRSPQKDQTPEIFAFSSHYRAAEALKFGLSMSEPGFNIFVLGLDRAGRMTATLDYLKKAMEERPAPQDWVYLNNFSRSNKPRPYALASGEGTKLADAMETLISHLREAFASAFNAPTHLTETQSQTEEARTQLREKFDALREYARKPGLDVQENEKGVMIVALNEEGEPVSLDEIPKERRSEAEDAFEDVAEEARKTLLSTRDLEEQIADTLDALRRSAAKVVLKPRIRKIRDKFTAPGLKAWFEALEKDILDNIDAFEEDSDQPTIDSGDGKMPETVDDRYAVNLLIDHSRDKHPDVVLEPSPSYDNLFGQIQYRPLAGGMHPHFSLIKPGALHRANGGVLVLRAESLVEHEDSWAFLKAALRDREIRIEETHKSGPPTAGAPEPRPIPLDVKVVIVGAPKYYYTFFSLDVDFRNHFRVKADIDADMPAVGRNISVYTGLLRSSALDRTGITLDNGAIRQLLGQAARWAGERDKLTAQIERVEDVAIEAGALAKSENRETIRAADVRRAIEERRHRNSRLEDRSHERVQRREILIDSFGAVAGQVNALTVLDYGDHAFGLPARVSARSYVGNLGVLNIERMVDMSGPLQQKSVMTIEGFLKSRFAQDFPISFACNVTFEQNYGGIEGDSASMAELCAIISAISNIPMRQNIGVTGSMNQFGQAQPVGGVSHKIEGFYRICADQGFTGDQGVIIPLANAENVVLREEVVQAIRQGKFNIWTVEHINDAIELLSGKPCGDHPDGQYPDDSVYGKAMERLRKNDRILRDRHAFPAWSEQ